MWTALSDFGFGGTGVPWGLGQGWVRGWNGVAGRGVRTTKAAARSASLVLKDEDQRFNGIPLARPWPGYRYHGQLYLYKLHALALF